MADNTTLNAGTGGDVIATDDLTTLNGGAVSGVKVQRVKVGQGADGSFTDVSSSNPLPVSLASNQSVNNAQVNGANVVTSVTGVQDVMPRKRTGSTGLSPNYFAARITGKVTTNVTAATAYVQSIVIACSAAGSSWTLTIQNKEATAKILVPAMTLTVPTTGPIAIQFQEPILMTSGIDIVTAGTTAGTVDVYVTYWQ